MSEVTRRFKTLSPGGCLTLPWGYIHVLNHKINCTKSDLRKEIFFKLATNDRSDKMFLMTSKFHSKRALSPCPSAIYMYKIIKKIFIKADFKEIFFKLVANDRRDKRFLLTSKFCPLGVVCP